MKLKFLLIISIILSLLLISCGSTPKNDTPVNEADDEVEFIDEEVSLEEDEDEDIEDEIIFEDEDDVEMIDEVVDLNNDEDDEYIRSTTDLAPEEAVTRQEFTDDKAAILELIDELKEIMEKGDVNAWLNHMDPDSIKYYSSPVNIRKAQKKLPNKAIQLNGIGDYFKFVFIPARKRSEVKEIRYISKNEIKAVDVKEDGGIVVYYQFVKKNNKWLVHIPTL